MQENPIKNNNFQLKSLEKEVKSIYKHKSNPNFLKVFFVNRKIKKFFGNDFFSSHLTVNSQGFVLKLKKIRDFIMCFSLFNIGFLMFTSYYQRNPYVFYKINRKKYLNSIIFIGYIGLSLQFYIYHYNFQVYRTKVNDFLYKRLKNEILKSDVMTYIDSNSNEYESICNALNRISSSSSSETRISKKVDDTQNSYDFIGILLNQVENQELNSNKTEEELNIQRLSFKFDRFNSYYQYYCDMIYSPKDDSFENLLYFQVKDGVSYEEIFEYVRLKCESESEEGGVSVGVRRV